MGNILVFLQHEGGSLPKGTLQAIKAAQEIKLALKCEKLVGVSFGSEASKAAADAASYGLSDVLYDENSIFDKYLAKNFEDAVVAAAKELSASVVVGAASSTGKDLLPRVAAKLEAGQASDIIGINSDGTLRRPMYAGDVIADVEILTPSKVISVRTTAFSPAAKEGSSGNVKSFAAAIDSSKAGEVVSYDVSKGGRPELTDAEVVVSGGRALQSSENFEKYIFPLADALGAAVGASRAAVDSGYAPNDWQVGQTGKVVAPSLYIAVGISGAIQHLAGMKDSKVIVAINKDGDAPIYEVADYGLVADLFTAVPELTEAVKRAKG